MCITLSIPVVLLANYLFQIKFINPTLWMIFTGLGLFLGYIPFNAVLFDRFIAAFHIKGNANFFI